MTRLDQELTVRTPIGPGEGPRQKLVQELLAINGIKVKIDSDWGPATSIGLRQFDGTARVVDQALMDRLAQPLRRASKPIVGAGSLATAIVMTARQHLKEHPIEVGGPNAGIWVRYYMDGFEGPKWAWCAGFVTRVIEQAAAGMGVAVPAHLKRTYSCDVLGAAARKAGKLHAGGSVEAASGAVFLVRGAHDGDWVHTGLIIGVTDEVFTTIEGNTNDEGSREGYEVCLRYRKRANLDVVTL